MNEDKIDMPELPPPSLNWQAVAAFGAIALTVMGFIYTQVERSSATHAIQANHTAQIAQLQISLNTDQTLLYAIDDSLAKLTQQIEDDQAAASRRRHNAQ
jgi:hypothetical protein